MAADPHVTAGRAVREASASARLEDALAGYEEATQRGFPGSERWCGAWDELFEADAEYRQVAPR